VKLQYVICLDSSKKNIGQMYKTMGDYLALLEIKPKHVLKPKTDFTVRIGKYEDETEKKMMRVKKCKRTGTIKRP